MVLPTLKPRENHSRKIGRVFFHFFFSILKHTVLSAHRYLQKFYCKDLISTGKWISPIWKKKTYLRNFRDTELSDIIYVSNVWIGRNCAESKWKNQHHQTVCVSVLRKIQLQLYSMCFGTYANKHVCAGSVKWILVFVRWHFK